VRNTSYLEKLWNSSYIFKSKQNFEGHTKFTSSMVTANHKIHSFEANKLLHRNYFIQLVLNQLVRTFVPIRNLLFYPVTPFPSLSVENPALKSIPNALFQTQSRINQKTFSNA
jgi:hypothetical protein